MDNFKHLLEKLKKLNLPVNEFAIFGGGALAIRGIRDTNDLDIIVKKDLWNKLLKKYPGNNDNSISIGKIEIWKDLLPLSKDVDLYIDNPDKINGIKVVKLKYILARKKLLNRKKDQKDIKLIEKYLEN